MHHPLHLLEDHSAEWREVSRSIAHNAEVIVYVTRCVLTLQ